MFKFIDKHLGKIVLGFLILQAFIYYDRIINTAAHAVATLKG